MATAEPRRFAIPRWALTALAVAALWVLWTLRELVILVAYAVLIAYALQPLVALLEKIPVTRTRRMPRQAAAAIAMSVVVGIVGVLLAFGVPRLVTEIVHFLERLPSAIEEFVIRARALAAQHGLSAYFDPVLDGLRSNASGLLQNAGGMLGTGAARVLGGLAQVIGLLLLPVLSFYLLAEQDAVRRSVLDFLPPDSHARFEALAGAVDEALRSYVRGQALVCAVMGVTVGTGLAVLGYPFALLLGVLVGIVEAIPYVGFTIAMVAIAFTGFTVSPWLGAAGIVTYTVLNALVGALVTPRVMGRHLKMHPFVVTVSILAGAELLGAPGAALALPAAASIQAVVQELMPATSRVWRAKEE